MNVAHTSGSLSRRQFVGGAAAAALAFTALKPGLVAGADANSKIEIGLIGCGGRGGWIADLFERHGGYKIVAAADYFEDRVNTFGDRFKVEAGRRYTTLSGYKKMLESKLDAVVIESPPYFHAEQAAAAVEAGRHVYCAKPIAVDVPGCMTFEQAGKKATEKKLVFLADFQTRANPFYMEAIKRIHEGGLGRIALGEAQYYGGALGAADAGGMSPQEARLRRWVYDIGFSGDVITEQFIHALDVATWVLDEAPVKAVGGGGQSIRTGVGDCWDHFQNLFWFKSGVMVHFAGTQFGNGHANGIFNRYWGQFGTFESKYGGQVNIFGDGGKEGYRGGDTGDIYQSGAATNIATFHDSIKKGQFDNPTVAPSVRSNLTTILGRTAAYEKREVTWEEIIKANKPLPCDLSGLKA